MKSFVWVVEERHIPALRRNFKTGEQGEGPDHIVDSLLEQGVARLVEQLKKSRKVAADEPPSL
jgi:hypothetical protein